MLNNTDISMHFQAGAWERDKYMGSFTHDGDFVGEGLGGNSGNNGQASIIDRINLINAFELFGSDSSHSSYSPYEKEFAPILQDVVGYKP